MTFPLHSKYSPSLVLQHRSQEAWYGLRILMALQQLLVTFRTPSWRGEEMLHQCLCSYCMEITVLTYDDAVSMSLISCFWRTSRNSLIASGLHDPLSAVPKRTLILFAILVVLFYASPVERETWYSQRM